MFVPTSSMALK